MPITRSKKEAVMAKLADISATSKSVVFVNFHGLPISDTTLLRAELRGKGIGYTVAKKTLVKRALSEASVTGELPVLDGELALAYGEDLMAPAREILAFQKKFEDKVSIMGGIFDGTYKTKAEMTEIASIPDLKTLRGMFVNLINSPIQGLVIALDGIAGKKNA